MAGEVATRWAEHLVGRTLAGRYVVERLLGIGGMGAVFAATQLTIKRAVAIKILTPLLADRREFIERFRREAMLAASVDANGVVAVIDFDRDPEVGPFLVMELLAGESLEERLARAPPLAIDEAIGVALAALATLAAVHAQRIVHRDLKPANIFLTERGVKLLDFGIARVIAPSDDGLTHPGALLGTPRYMAREQAMGSGDVDHRADLYAMGAIVYCCLAGEPPYASLTSDSVLRAVQVGDAPVPLRALRPELPASLCAVVERAMSPFKSARFADAQRMRDALALAGGKADALSTDPPPASAPSPTTRENASIRATAASSAPSASPSSAASPPSARSPSSSARAPAGSPRDASASTTPGRIVATTMASPLSDDSLARPMPRRPRALVLALAGAVVAVLATTLAVTLASRPRTASTPDVSASSDAGSELTRANVDEALALVRASPDDTRAAGLLDELLRRVHPPQERSLAERELAGDLFLAQGHLRERRLALPPHDKPLTRASLEKIEASAVKARASYTNASTSADNAPCTAIGHARVTEAQVRAWRRAIDVAEVDAMVRGLRETTLRALEQVLEADRRRVDPIDGIDCYEAAAKAREAMRAALAE